MKNIVFTQYLYFHCTTLLLVYCYSFQFQRLLEEATVEKERLVTELQYVIFLVLDALDINDGGTWQ